MDAKEKQLTDAYNKALERLKPIPKGHPAHVAASARLMAAYRALQKYQRRSQN